jgi:WD40 repeat protein
VSDCYHVYLSISQFGDQFRSELFTEDLGSTDGELLPVEWKGIEDWYSFLVQGAADLPPDAAEKLGEKLFGYVLGNRANKAKWADTLRHLYQRDPHQVLRLLVDTSIFDEVTAESNDRVHNLPYGLLRDPEDHYYLFRPREVNQERPEIQFVRILRRCTPRPLKLRKPVPILLAAAEPSDQQFQFHCPDLLAELARSLQAATTGQGEKAFAVFLCLPTGARPLDELLADSALPAAVCRVTREALKDALASGDFDIVHLLAHGFGTGLALCDAQGRRIDVLADELAAWCGANPRLQLAFLQACWGSQTGGRGSFGGVAQRLLNPKGGNLAAVIASSYPLDARQSTEAAIAFYNALARNVGPEMAVARNLLLANWCWALLELWVRLGLLGRPEGPAAAAGGDGPSDTGRGGKGRTDLPRVSIQYLSPYRGLSGFQERDAPLFFGRDAEVIDLLHVLEKEPVVMIGGDPGSGKSSLLRAGLAHKVRLDGLAGRAGWQIVLFRPGEHPARNLLAALAATAGKEPPGTAEVSGEVLRAQLAAACSPEKPLLLLCDQFEELFTLCRNEAERLPFAQVLAEFARDHAPDFRLVFTVRSDFLGAAAALSTALPGALDLPRRPWLLGPPAPEAIQAIIAKPAERCGFEFEKARNDGDPRHQQPLLERILKDPLLTPLSPGAEAAPPAAPTTAAAAPRTTPLPLLEFALEQLWRSAVNRDRDSHLFTHADYDSLGGLAGAIAQYAEKAYQQLLMDGPAETVQPVLEGILKGVVSLRGALPVRQPRPRNQLEAETGNAEVASQVIDRLIDDRLLTVRRNPSHPGDRARALVELAHEVLIDRWDRLKALLTENPRYRQLKEQFLADFERYEQGLPPETPPRHWLPSVHAASRYLGWIDIGRPALSDEQKAFAEALRGLVKRRKQLVATGVITAVTAAVVLGALSVIAWWEWRQAVKAQRLQLAAQAQLLAQTPGREIEALRAAVQAVGTRPEGSSDIPQQVADALLAAVTAAKASLPLRGHEKEVYAVAFDRTGQWLASASEDGTARVWEVETGRLRQILRGPPQGLRTVAFSPDGSRLVAAGVDPTVWVWEWQTARAPRVWKGHQDLIWSATFSRDGKQVLTASEDGTARVWDAGTGKSLPPLEVKGAKLTTAAFAPDGRLIVTADDQGRWQLWDATSGKTQPDRSTGRHGDRIWSAGFSPDGSTLVTASADGTARIWDLNGQQRQLLQHGTGPLFFAGFSPDGKHILTAGKDRQARLYRYDANEKVWSWQSVFRGHAEGIYSAAFAPGNRVATASGDRTVRLWVTAKDQALLDARIIQEETSFASIGWSSDGTRVVAAGGDNAGWVWESETGKRLQKLAGHTGHTGHTVRLNSAAFSPQDRRRVVTASEDGKARVWDVVTGKTLHTLSGPGNKLYAAAFSPDGHRIVTAGEGGRWQLWDAESGRPLPGGPRRGHDQAIWSASFSPNGQELLTAGPDGTARVWEAQTGRQLKIFPRSVGELNSAAFAPDGQRVVTGGEDGTARIWNRQTARLLTKLVGHTDRIDSVAFSPGGKRVVTGAEDGTVRIWLAETGELQTVLRGREQVQVSAAFSPDGRQIVTADFNGTVRIHAPPSPMSLVRQACDLLRRYPKEFKEIGDICPP